MTATVLATGTVVVVVVVVVAVVAAHAAGHTRRTHTVHDVIETGLEVGDLLVDFRLRVLAGGNLGLLARGEVVENRRLHLLHVEALRLGDIGKRLARLQFGLQLIGGHAENLGDRISSGHETAGAVTTLAVTLFAAHAAGHARRTHTVHDVIETGLEVGDLLVDFRLRVLAGGNLGLLARGEVVENRRLHLLHVEALRLGDIGKRLARLQFGLQLIGGHAENLGDRIRRDHGATDAVTTLATHGHRAVDDVVDLRLQIGDLLVDFRLRVLTRGDLGLFAGSEVVDDRLLHLRDVDALRLGDIGERLTRLQFGLQFVSSQAEHLRNGIRRNRRARTAGGVVRARFAAGRALHRDGAGKVGCSTRGDVVVSVGRCIGNPNDGVLRERSRGSLNAGAGCAGESGNSECESGDEASGNPGHHAGGHDALLQCWLVLHLCLLVRGVLPVFAAADAVTGHNFVVVPENLPKDK